MNPHLLTIRFIFTIFLFGLYSPTFWATTDTNSCFNVNSISLSQVEDTRNLSSGQYYKSSEIESLIPNTSTCLLIIWNKASWDQTNLVNFSIQAASQYQIPYYIQGNIFVSDTIRVDSNTHIIGIDRSVSWQIKKARISSYQNDLNNIFLIKWDARDIKFKDLEIYEVRTVSNALIASQGRNINISIDSVDFQGRENNPDQITAWVKFSNDFAKNIYIKNSSFNKLEYWIQIFAPVKNFQVNHSYFTNWNHYAIVNNRSDDDINFRTEEILISHNIFERAAIWWDRGVIFISSGASYYYIKDVQVLNNTVTWNGGFFTKPKILTKLWYSQVDAEEIALNSNAHWDQIVLHRVNGFQISHNTVTKWWENGITTSRLSRNWIISNNTVSLHDGNGINIGGGYFELILDDVSGLDIWDRIQGAQSRNIATIEKIFPYHNVIGLEAINNNNKRSNPDPITATTFLNEPLEIIPDKIWEIQPPNRPTTLNIINVDRTKKIKVLDNEVFDNGLNQFPEKWNRTLSAIFPLNVDSVEFRRNNIYNTISRENQWLGIIPSRSRNIYVDDSNCFEGMTMNPYNSTQNRMGLLTWFDSRVPAESEIMPSACPLPNSNPQRCVTINMLDDDTIRSIYDTKSIELEAIRNSGARITTEQRKLSLSQISSLVPTEATCVSLKGEPSKSNQWPQLRLSAEVASMYDIPLEIEGTIHTSQSASLFSNTKIIGLNNAQIKTIAATGSGASSEDISTILYLPEGVENISLKNIDLIEDYPVSSALLLMAGKNKNITTDNVSFVWKDPHPDRETRGIFLSKYWAQDLSIRNSNFENLEYGIHMFAPVNWFKLINSNFSQWAHYAILLNRWWASMERTSRSIHISDSKFEHAIAWGSRGVIQINPGASLSYIHDVKILRNTITWNAGAYMNIAEDPDFANNDAHADQIILHRVNNFEIVANDISFGGENGITVSRLSRNWVIRNNKIYNNDGQGIAVWSSYFFMTVSNPELLRIGDRIRWLTTRNIATVTAVYTDKNLISVGSINGKPRDINSTTFINEDIEVFLPGVVFWEWTPVWNISHIDRTKNIDIINNKIYNNGINFAEDKNSDSLGATFIINSDNISYDNNKFYNTDGWTYQSFAIDASRSSNIDIMSSNTVEWNTIDLWDRSHVRLKNRTNVR